MDKDQPLSTAKSIDSFSLKKRRIAAGAVLGFLLLTPFAARAIIDQHTAWSTLSQTYPSSGITPDSVLWFRTAFVNEVQYTGTIKVAWNSEYIILNYHILYLPGGTETAIPWSKITGKHQQIGLVNWVVLTAPDIPEIWIRPSLADTLGLHGDTILVRGP